MFRGFYAVAIQIIDVQCRDCQSRSPTAAALPRSCLSCFPLGVHMAMGGGGHVAPARNCERPEDDGLQYHGVWCGLKQGNAIFVSHANSFAKELAPGGGCEIPDVAHSHYFSDTYSHSSARAIAKIKNLVPMIGKIKNLLLHRVAKRMCGPVATNAFFLPRVGPSLWGEREANLAHQQTAPSHQRIHSAHPLVSRARARALPPTPRAPERSRSHVLPPLSSAHRQTTY